MKMVTFLLLSAVAFCSADYYSGYSSGYNNILTEEYCQEINSKQSQWKAGKNFDPRLTTSQLHTYFGVNKYSKFADKFEVERIQYNEKDHHIPISFDARDNWRECRSIREIADQSACCSSWAIATANAISDRICIATKGVSCPSVSAINLISCCADCGDGCDGGVPILAWRYWHKSGIVSGGPPNSTLGCQSYPFKSCEYHLRGSSHNCPNKVYEAPKCYHKCDKNWSKSYKESLSYGRSHYFVVDSSDQIQREVLKNGPVVADIEVFSDFFSYKSGVYKHVVGKFEGYHAVRIIGWGVENDQPYWLCANSWSYHWGDYGFFKIVRGENECGIEADVCAGLPRLY